MNISRGTSGFLVTALALSAGLLLDGCRTLKFLVTGSKPHDHNLNYVACDNTIVQVNGNTGTAYEDELVFLCKGQTITWSAPSGTGSFTVDFGAESPFDTGQISIPSQNGTIGPLSVVGPPPGRRAKAFKYRLTVGGTPFDPHVIIMGGS